MSLNSKQAIPWGNTFDYVDPLTGTPLFDCTHGGSGQQVFMNRALAPVDAAYNPDGAGYMADLLQGSADPAKLGVNNGVKITYQMPCQLVAGNTYTISCWARSRYLNEYVNFSLLGSGNWTMGLQTQGSKGNFADASWKFLNGGITLVQQSIEGTLHGVGDLGIPSDIPSEHILFSKRADHIRAVPSGGDSLWVMDTISSHGTVYDLATAQNLTSLLQGVKNSTLVYQEIDPASGVTSVLVDWWARIAQETVVGGNITVNPAVTAGITGLAIIFTDTQGRRIIQVYHSYLSLTTSWRQEYNTFTTTPTWLTRDVSKPIGYGFFFTGDLAVYGGLRIQDNSTLLSSPTLIHSNSDTRVCYTFTANGPMQDTLSATAHPGFFVPLVFDGGHITVTLAAGQPAQPMINGQPDPAYLPWAPIWASVYLYGLWINDGDTAGVYQIDSPLPVVMRGDISPSLARGYYPTVKYPTGHPQNFTGPAPLPRPPKHQLGLNQTGNGWYSSAQIFLNLAKMSSASRYRAGLDNTGVLLPKPTCGWFMYDASTGTFNTLGSGINVTGMVFNSGQNYFTVPWGANITAYDPSVNTWPDRSLIGPSVPAGMKVTGVQTIGSDPATAVLKFTCSANFASNSSADPAIATTAYHIKKYPYDSPADLSLNGNGYPTIIPPNCIPFGLAYRMTPAPPAPGQPMPAGMLNNPFLPSGNYVLKWDGTGTATLTANVGLTPSRYPVAVVSSSSNRVVYYVDCSGNTADGTPVNIEYELDTVNSLRPQSQCGFILAITSTSANDPVRNLRLVEEQYESLLDSGEKFYPTWLERVQEYRTLRFLDWTATNAFQPFTYDLNQKPNIDDISYAANYSHVPWEIIIELCNRTQKNAWINLHPNASPDLQAWVANLFAATLDPRLRVYVEYGNEPWNGALGSGYYCHRYAVVNNVSSPPGSPNPDWSASEHAYALLSQQAFTIWEDAFAGSRGLLQPARLYDDPKYQKRRLVRVAGVNSGGYSNAMDIFSFAAPYTTNPYGVPYDAIASNAYNPDMLGQTVRNTESAVAPNAYPWSLDEISTISWQGLANQEATCANTYTAITNNVIPNSGGSNNLFGFDKDGAPLQPAYLLYEGGWGSPGPSEYMLYGIMQLKFGADGDARTVYNLYKSQLQWWDSLVANDATRNKDLMMYNLWETPKPYSGADQWGITDKSFYSRRVYNSFPIIQAVAESAGSLLPTITVGAAPNWTPQASHPKIFINGEWIRLDNVHLMDSDGDMVIRPASMIKYSWAGEWW
jgi:hypothetical protein